ncbi:MAG: phosphate uptake regulator PhoU [Nanoarchaeota archaeon]|nr:phosphate uptake regulator PhoU [Nanoarchaeota archaeon]MBU1631575.1 phosphate uptake regulator PhoU [Nanoarchaeota archaeon]MBU1875491.1 phosphate uptake regulator PhoU [Nanoarchaeota archaeon]
MKNEYRKLISFGKSSYVISLPKAWVNQNQLKKGDLIYFDEKEKDLILSTGTNLSEDKEITIPVDGKSIRRLQREIISAYIKDYKSITLIGNEIKSKAKDIQNTIQNLMALEVMEQTSSKIVAKDFLDMNNISIFNLLRKMDVIIRAMIEDCEKMFDEDNYENIFHRDHDVNRLSFLIFRIVEFGLKNSSFVYKKYKLDSRNILHLWWFAFNMETIADEVKRIARYMAKAKLSDKEKKRFLKLFTEVRLSYLDVMKSFHNRDEELTHKVLERKEEIIKECELFYLDNQSKEFSGLMVERLKSMLNLVHNTGRIVYQYGFTEE